MASLVSGFEYDIFISYRHNDNRSGWVSEFVRSLQEELGATIKEPVSVYFDTNPYDGLLETHNVDKSLEVKLKSLILIPVISQTYCDTRSFAWQHEFSVFNKMSQADGLGRDIKLANGNVASRILPVRIHDLDAEDKAILETELASAIRSIEFIYRSPGVNRPLSPGDNPEKNINKTFYRDQINKVANAVKEIIFGIKYKDKTFEAPRLNEPETTKKSPDVKPAVINNSIAVLPFVSLTQDSSQTYFADGIMENILIQLASLRHLRVISRTSVMRFEKTTKSAAEIAEELGVKYLLEGSAQSHGSKVRIHVQLIDAALDQHVWGKVFVESLEDIFAIQNTVAETVAKELNAAILPNEKTKLNEIPTKNIAAYDLYLKGRHAFHQWNLAGYRTAEQYFIQALDMDPDFTQAYSFLASTYSALMSWNGDLSPAESLEKINVYLPEALKRGASDNDYLTKGYVEFFISKDFAAAEQWLQKAMDVGPNNAEVLYTYSYVLNMMGRSEEALKYIARAKAIDPTSVSAFNYQGISLYLLQRYEEAVSTFQEGLRMYPHSLRQRDHLARVFLTMGDFQSTVNTVLYALQQTSIRPPSMVAYLAAGHIGLRQNEKATLLVEELITRSRQHEKGINVYIAHVYNALGDATSALSWMEKAVASNDVDLIWRNVDPLLKHLPKSSVSPNYEEAEQFITRKLKDELPGSLHYHNFEHIQDVLQAAMAIAGPEKLSIEELHLLRIAALFHDSGFIFSPKHHEEKGCEMANQILPAFGFVKGQIDIVCGMILATRIPQTPQTLLEKILCDADLDYLGREDFYQVGERLGREMRDSGLIETDREWNLIQKTFLESHRYHTRYAQSHREELKKRHLQEILLKFKKPNT